MTWTQLVWGRLPNRYMVLGEQAGRKQQGVADARHLSRRGWRSDHGVTPLETNIRGMQSELAFRLFTQRRIPTVDELLASWNKPDVDNLQVKASAGLRTKESGMQLTPRHLESSCDYVLMFCGARPRFAIVGRITRARALRVALRPDDLPPGHIIVPWPAFEPYDGPLDHGYVDQVLFAR